MGTSIWGCVTSNHAYILGSYAITLLTGFTSLGLGIHTDDHILALGGFTIPLLLLMLPPCIAIIIKMVL